MRKKQEIEPVIISEVIPPDTAQTVEINNRPVICLHCSHNFVSGFHTCKEKDEHKVYIQCPSCNKWNIIRRVLLSTANKPIIEKTAKTKKDDTLIFEIL